MGQKLLVVAGAVTVTFEIVISSIAMFSPLVADVADILTLVKNFFLLVLQNLTCCFLFSLFTKSFEKSKSAASILQFPKDISLTHLLPREAENNYFSALLITSLATARKTTTPSVILNISNCL